MSLYNEGISDMGDKTNKLGGLLSGAGKAIAGVGIAAGAAIVGGVAALGKGLFDCTQEAMSAQEAMAALDQVILSTGGAAGVTSKEAADLATQMQSLTRFSDEEIMAAETLLLQFETMNKETFPDATRLTLDLATRLGTDAASAASLLGKALAEPGEGLNRLKQAGITFTDAEEKAIKAMYEGGDAAGAQAAIMAKLEKSVGGAAQAAGKTFAGSMDILKNKVSDIKEGIGMALLPMLTTLSEAFSKALADPRVQEALQKVADLIGGVAKFIGNLILQLGQTDDVWEAVSMAFEGTPFEGLQQGFNNVRNAIEGVVTWVKENLVPIFQAVVSWFQGEGSSSIEGFVGKITEFLEPAIEFAAEMFEQIVDWVEENWPLIQETVTTVMEAVGTVIETVLGAIKKFWDEHGEAIMTIVENMWEMIKTTVDTVIKVVQGIIKAVMLLITGDWESAWKTIKETAETLWTGIKTLISLAIDNVKTILTTAYALIKTAWETLWTGIKSKAEEIWGQIVSAVTGWIDDIKATFTSLTNIDKFKNIAKALWGALKDAAAAKWTEVTGAVSGWIDDLKAKFSAQNIIDKFKNMGKAIVEGIKQGVSDWWENLKSHIGGLIGGLVTWIKTLLGITSPSSVFASIGENMVLGLAQGFNDAQRAWASLASGGLNATMNLGSAAVAGGMTAMSAAGAGGGSATTINNSVSMSMPTTINNGMDAAAFQARVLQTVTRAVRGY